MSDNNKLEKVVNWAKRRGFVYPSSEIYGGLGGVYNFGRNFRDVTGRIYE